MTKLAPTKPTKPTKPAPSTHPTKLGWFTIAALIMVLGYLVGYFLPVNLSPVELVPDSASEPGNYGEFTSVEELRFNESAKKVKPLLKIVNDSPSN